MASEPAEIAEGIAIVTKKQELFKLGFSEALLQCDISNLQSALSAVENDKVTACLSHYSLNRCTAAKPPSAQSSVNHTPAINLRVMFKYIYFSFCN